MLTKWDLYEGGSKTILLTYLVILPTENFALLDAMIVLILLWFGPVALLIYILEGGFG